MKEHYSDTFVAKFENVGPIVERVEAWLGEAGVDSVTAAFCMLALSEALNNIVEHSFPDTPDGSATLNVFVSDNRANFQIVDEGVAPPAEMFDCKREMPDPFDLPEGGWGLAVIEAVMDDVTYTHHEGVNKLDLVKKVV